MCFVQKKFARALQSLCDKEAAKYSTTPQSERRPHKYKVTFDLEPKEMVKNKEDQCENCRKRKRKPDQSQRLNAVLKSFHDHVAKDVRGLIQDCWCDFQTGSPEIIRFQPVGNQPLHTIRLNQHLALREMKREDELRWLWRALALIRNLQSHEDFLGEFGYTTKEERESQKARDRYLRYLYKGRK